MTMTACIFLRNIRRREKERRVESTHMLSSQRAFTLNHAFRKALKMQRGDHTHVSPPQALARQEAGVSEHR